MELIPGVPCSFLVPEAYRGSRLDQLLTRTFMGYSRTMWQRYISHRYVQINGKTAHKGSIIVPPDGTITITIPLPSLQTPDVAAFNTTCQVQVIHETDRFIIINKPAGLLVHKPVSHSTALTLVDWLLTQYPDIATVGDHSRPGIVHRLDQHTSGLMIIPRDIHTHVAISTLFHDRAIKKTYYAIVAGRPPIRGEIDFYITRDPHKRILMTYSRTMGKSAYTRYTVLQQYQHAALIAAYPTTGRTHQIRVHLLAHGYPIIGDPIYHVPSPFIERQALHAAEICFTLEGTDYTFKAPMPADMTLLLSVLQQQYTHSESLEPMEMCQRA